MARLNSNENFPYSVVLELRRLGHDVVTSLESGKANHKVPDQDVLAYSTIQTRALLTLNRRDFIKLHLQDSGHAGIITCTVDPDSIGLANRIDAQLRIAGPLAGQLLRVNRPV